MSKKEIKLNIFVASPSDVINERNLINKTCLELNKVWGNWLKLNLNVIRWEDDIYPGVSEYSQKVINNQIDDDFDIFIGMFWNRFGTPTGGAESGTQEEIELAFNKLHSDHESVDIMIYFKNQTVAYDDKEQQEKIQNYKRKLSQKGTLYWDFNDSKEFETLIRIHLSKVAQKWSKKYSSDNANSNNISKNLYNNLLLDELSLGDYYGIVSARTKVLQTLTMNIATIYKFNIDESKKFSEEIKKSLDEKSLIVKQLKLLRLLKIYLMSVDDTVNVIKSQIPSIAHARLMLFETLSKIISLEIVSESNERIKILKNTVNQLHKLHTELSGNIANSILMLNENSFFKNNQSINNLITTLTDYQNETDKFIKLSSELLDIINQLRD